MTIATRPQPVHYSEFTQLEDPPVEKMRGWPLVGVYAGVLSFCIAVWWGLIAATDFLLSGP